MDYAVSYEAGAEKGGEDHPDLVEAEAVEAEEDVVNQGEQTASQNGEHNDELQLGLGTWCVGIG